MKFLIINGPNLNLLGLREPDIYGRQDFKALEQFIRDACAAAGVEATLFQSNHEGAIIDVIQQAYGNYDGIVINPAAYTHTSVAILDALKAVQIPAVEVHISDVSRRDSVAILDALKAVNIPAVEVHLSDVTKRESFRQLSYPGMACIKSYIGLGFEGYRQAVLYLKDYLEGRI